MLCPVFSLTRFLFASLWSHGERRALSSTDILILTISELYKCFSSPSVFRSCDQRYRLIVFKRPDVSFIPAPA